MATLQSAEAGFTPATSGVWSKQTKGSKGTHDLLPPESGRVRLFVVGP